MRFRDCMWVGLSMVLSSTFFVAVSPAASSRERLAARPGPLAAEIRPTAPRFGVAEGSDGWSFVSPAGQKFFSLGVCCVSQGIKRDLYDQENPSYAAWQQYSNSSAWAAESLRRLKNWGFTTIGGWSDFETLRQTPTQTLYLTPVLHIGSTAGAPWWDMWDSKIIRRMEEAARTQILALRDDPRLLGYYSDNELGWWNATLWKMTLEHPASSGQRQRLLALLHEVYQDDWKKLLADFEPEGAENWKELGRGGMLYLRPGSKAITTMRRCLGMLADRYYELMSSIIRKYDSRALFLGDRYQSFFYPEVTQAAARYVDVISSNLNAHWNDGSFLRSYLETLHSSTGKPILISEYYLAATENRSGNRNSAGVFPVVPTQAERAAAARSTLQGLARLPFVVGADWFQFFDEPAHGREDGENYNFGLVDVQGRPYDEVTSMLAQIDPASLRKEGQARLDASAGIPAAPADPLRDFVPRHAMREWDRERGYVNPISSGSLSDLYLCWNAGAFYLGLYSLDIVEAAYYRSASVPKIDRALWTVRLNGRELVRARIGAGREPLSNEPRIRLENSSGLNNNVCNLAAMEVPATFLGKNRLQAGDVVELDSTLLTHCGAYRVEWKGRFTLR